MLLKFYPCSMSCHSLLLLSRKPLCWQNGWRMWPWLWRNINRMMNMHSCFAILISDTLCTKHEFTQPMWLEKMFGQHIQLEWSSLCKCRLRAAVFVNLVAMRRAMTCPTNRHAQLQAANLECLQKSCYLFHAAHNSGWGWFGWQLSSVKCSKIVWVIDTDTV